MGLSDPSKVLFVSQMLKGYGIVGFRLDSRLPITLPILDRLVAAASSLEGSAYQIISISSYVLTGFCMPFYALEKLPQFLSKALLLLSNFISSPNC